MLGMTAFLASADGWNSINLHIGFRILSRIMGAVWSGFVADKGKVDIRAMIEEFNRISWDTSNFKVEFILRLGVTTSGRI